LVHLYPKQTEQQLEFEKIKHYLVKYCKTDDAKEQVANLRFHTKLNYLENELKQIVEYKTSMSIGDYFPNNFNRNLQKLYYLVMI
jgi:DNA mismatch repair protein MutS2